MGNLEPFKAFLEKIAGALYHLEKALGNRPTKDDIRRVRENLNRAAEDCDQMAMILERLIERQKDDEARPRILP